MELANGKTNKFFTLEDEGENRYCLEDFDAEASKGVTNVYSLAKEIKSNSIVLDVGCAQGRFGKILKEKNCTLYGIDIDEKAVEYAKNRGYYDKVFVMDVTDKDSDAYKENISKIQLVDVIILSDLLEHVIDPTRLLLEYSKLLKDGGDILISVPNAAHIDILLNLMNDKFNYQDMGILDNTHLKFYTKTSFIDWIIQINETFQDIKFDCRYLGATFYNNTFIKEIKEKYNELFTILENSRNYNGLQIMFKLTKLPIGSETLELEKLKAESKIDVVEILGEALKGKIVTDQNHKIVEGERLWYEQQLKILKEGINWHHENDKKAQEYVKELEDGLNWHNENDKKVQEYIKELEEGLNWHNENNSKVQKYIKELEEGLNWHNENSKKTQEYIKKIEEGINWHNENNKNMQEYIEQREIEIESQRKKDKKELLELRKKVFDMENSRSWRWTKIFRKSR